MNGLNVLTQYNHPQKIKYKLVLQEILSSNRISYFAPLFLLSIDLWNGTAYTGSREYSALSN